MVLKRDFKLFIILVNSFFDLCMVLKENLRKSIYVFNPP